jgi:hypothetical protein
MESLAGNARRFEEPFNWDRAVAGIHCKDLATTCSSVRKYRKDTTEITVFGALPCWEARSHSWSVILPNVNINK